MENNSCQSLTTWEAAIRWLGMMLGVTNKHWRYNARYLEFREALLKDLLVPAQQRHPINVEWLLAYAKRRNLHKTNLYEVDFNLLGRWTALLWLFFLILRPSELLRRSSRDKSHGLNIENIRLTRLVRGGAQGYTIQIDRFKTAKSRRSIKTTYMRNPQCYDPTCVKCAYLNPVRCYNVLRHRRKEIYRRMRSGAMKDRLNTYNGSNPAFVRDDGYPIVAKHVADLIKEVAANAGVTTLTMYSTYSARIGATTHCSRIHINNAKICQYVGWQINKLPDMAHRYTLYPPQSLQWMAHDMIHNKRGDRTYHEDNVHIFDPWSAFLRWDHNVRIQR